MDVLFEVLISIAIFSARIVDVSLDTLRVFAVVSGRRGVAWMLALCQVVVWLLAVSSVINHIWDRPWYAAAYALGFATGNFVGISIEQIRAQGEQVIRIFSRKGAEIAAVLRGEGFGVTEFTGRGKDGEVTMLLIRALRRDAMRLAHRAEELDPDSYFILDDIRLTSDSVTRARMDPPLWGRFVGRRNGST